MCVASQLCLDSWEEEPPRREREGQRKEAALVQPHVHTGIRSYCTSRVSHIHVYYCSVCSCYAQLSLERWEEEPRGDQRKRGATGTATHTGICITRVILSHFLPSLSLKQMYTTNHKLSHSIYHVTVLYCIIKQEPTDLYDCDTESEGEERRTVVSQLDWLNSASAVDIARLQETKKCPFSWQTAV